MPELFLIFLRIVDNFLSCISLALEMILLLETKDMNVIYIAHFTIKTILNLYNLLLE